MDNQITTSKAINFLGFFAAILVSTITAVTFVIAYLTEPLSGPWCKGSCFAYPFLETASRFPADFIWMYPAILLLLVYLVLMVVIHYYSSTDKKVFSQIGMFFAFGSVMVLIVDYFLQLSVIQPSLLKGEADGISLLTQFNPHGVFIALEEIGYILMSFSFLFMAPVFLGSKLKKAIRWVFISAFVLMVLSFTLFSVGLGVNREYLFEVTAISICWTTLIVSGILLSIVFRKAISSLPQERATLVS